MDGSAVWLTRRHHIAEKGDSPSPLGNIAEEALERAAATHPPLKSKSSQAPASGQALLCLILAQGTTDRRTTEHRLGTARRMPPLQFNS